MLKASFFTLGLFSATLALSGVAAAEDITVMTDETTLIKLAGKPGTVAVGNPSIADATIENGHLFVIGRSFGSTNLIVLDTNGKQLVDLSINVQAGGGNNVALFGAGIRKSMMCAPLCEATVQPGDEVAYSGNILSVTQQKAALAGSVPQQDASSTQSGNTPQ
jgi:Flp pilus assembly secretin CpaC